MRRGLVATGNVSGIIVGSTSVTGNTMGGLSPSGGGVLYSYGTNYVNGNPGGDGGFTATIAQK